MQTQAQEIQVTLAEVKEKVALAEALDQLHRSPAFKKLILKEYIKDKPAQLVKLTALPQTDTQKELVMNGMIGISALQQFFASVYRDGEQAKEDLAAYEQELTMENADA